MSSRKIPEDFLLVSATSTTKLITKILMFLFLISFQQNSEGTITFKLVPADCRMNIRESKVRVRSHFDYIAATDPYIPCKEAGLDFQKGDVLHIVSQDDAYW